MNKTKAIRDYLRQVRALITPGEWGRYGQWLNGKAPEPFQAALEAAPGLTIGSTQCPEPISRFSGYGHNAVANSDYITVAVNHLPELLDAIDELELENAALRVQILMTKANN